MDLYTNRNSKKDFIQNAFTEYAKNDMDIFIASAFFTESDVIDKLVQKKMPYKDHRKAWFSNLTTSISKNIKAP